MALEGTLADFSIPEILQKIDGQDQTGILTVYSGEDTVTVTFLKGRIVAATTSEKRPEDRLGNFLVHKKFISEEDLNRALADQEQTFDRLGQILLKKKVVDKPTLQKALQEQVSQIVRRLINLKQGFYHFKVEEKIHYDQENMTPLQVDMILLSEFAAEEEIEKLKQQFPSLSTQYVKTKKAEEHIIQELKMLGDFLAGETIGAPKQAKVRSNNQLSPFEKRLLKFLETPKTVQEVINEHHQGPQEALEVLLKMRGIDFVEEFVEKKSEEVVVAEEQDFDDYYEVNEQLNPLVYLPFVVAPLLIVVVLIAGGDPRRPFQAPAADTYGDFARIRTTLQIDSILTAIRLFAQSNQGQPPVTLRDLVDQNYVDEDMLTDAYGNALLMSKNAFAQTVTVQSPGKDSEFQPETDTNSDDIRVIAGYGEYRHPPAVYFPPSLELQEEQTSPFGK